MWEWGLLKGIRTSCVTQGYINGVEYIIHGDYNGKVYRQEQGNSFDGENIPAAYYTPYLDAGSPNFRKTLKKLDAFIRVEGELELTINVDFNWGDLNTPRPYQGVIEDNSVINSTYNSGAQYNQSGVKYATGRIPLLKTDLSGSFRSVRIGISASNTLPSYSIQALLIEFLQRGRR